MVIRIKKHTFFKPRRCPECHKICIFSRSPKAKCCTKCHIRQRRISRMANRRFKRKCGTYKYNNRYKMQRRKAIRQQPWCSLCGSTANLTTHHVGGGNIHLTVLCDECHQAYERYNHKRKVKQCIRKIGIGASGKRLRKAVLGIRLRILAWCLKMRNSRLKLETLNTRLEN